MMQNFSELKDALLSQARQKPVAERFRTRALGRDPAPIICFEVDGEPHIFDFTQDEPALDSRATPSLTIRCTWQTLRAVWNGQISALDAIADGSVELEGSLRIGHALQRYFTSGAEK